MKVESLGKDIKKDEVLDVNFWNYRWETNQTGWDIGYPSPPIADYFKQYDNKDAAILIPGCGSAYEAEFLVENGYKNITLVDISEIAVERLKHKFKDFPQVKCININLFEHTGKYDIIIEQTLFCALSLSQRTDYINKTHELLNNNGLIIGLLFDVIFETEGPPFGGHKKDYIEIFSPLFDIKIMEKCKNSIPQRMGNELFIKLQKRNVL